MKGSFGDFLGELLELLAKYEISEVYSTFGNVVFSRKSEMLHFTRIKDGRIEDSLGAHGAPRMGASILVLDDKTWENYKR